MRRILIDEKKMNPAECSFGFPWHHDATCYNFDMPNESIVASEIDEIKKKDNIETLVIGCDLDDYGFLMDLCNLRQLYIYSGSNIHNLNFVRNLSKLRQLYITNSHVESLEPVVDLVKVRKGLYDSEEDVEKRLFLSIEGICIDSDCELDGSSLVAFDGFVSEILINRKRIRRKHK